MTETWSLFLCSILNSRVSSLVKMKLLVQGETKATNYCAILFEKLSQFSGVEGVLCGGEKAAEISLKKFLFGYEG